MPHGTSASDADVLIVAELSANAVFHGRVPGDFALRLVHEPAAALVHVEVSDTRPALPVPLDPSADSDGGRGLILVEALADRWGVTDRNGPGKTTWAEVDLPPKTGARAPLTPQTPQRACSRTCRLLRHLTCHGRNVTPDVTPLKRRTTQTN
ncbi:ATP-binding protein [Streptomyces scabiei]|uniref:ATP-binding protein n=1 Tax=Streptomyces scabiei TaxID=1930 RepID=UPI0007C82201|nr:ATP-binding protein [Streptomyces scabiei]